jgi:ATP-dependent Clp protease ATP-binding subunit ClpA
LSGPVELPRDFQNLLDQAQAEAKRYGHDAANVLHVTLALKRRDAERLDAAVRPGAAADAASLLESVAALPADCAVGALDLLLGAAESEDRWAALYDQVKQRLPAPEAAAIQQTGVQPEPQATDPEVSAASGTTTLDVALQRVARYVEVVAPNGRIVGREQVLDQLISLLGRRTPATPAMLAAPGAGRTATFEALAARLADPSYRGPLAGTKVVRVKAQAIIADDRSRALSRVAEDVGDRAILVLDDLEVLAGLGGMSADLAMLGVVRSVIDTGQHRTVVTLAESFASKLEVHDAELADELSFIQLPVLEDPALQEIAANRAKDLAEFHQVEIPDGILRHATAAPPINSPRVHPGLLIERLDSACASAALRPERTVLMEDLNLATQFGDATQLDRERLIHRLAEVVVGQQPALERVASRLALTRAQLDLHPNRPDGVFLLIGPTGVGKTALARALSTALYGSEDALIRLDMSEYAHDWAVSRLVGPQPGFVGFTEPESWLTTRVREAPHSVILLDEIEKAHPTVWNTFLQVFDAGRLTDSRGQVADFRSAVVVMTSNVGSDAFRTVPLGFLHGAAEDPAEARVTDALKATMSPELINRIDEVIIFHPLTRAHIQEIAAREIDRSLARLAQRGYDLAVSDEVVQFIADVGYDPAYGARHLQRNVERLLLQPLVEVKPGSWRAVVTNGVVEWADIA